MIINYFKTTYTTMKKIKFFILLTVGAAGLFTACTSESDNSPSTSISYESIKAAEQVPVTFGTYLGEQAVTRAGLTSSLTIDSLAKASAEGGGFGVFAYYNESGNYPETTGSSFTEQNTLAPNFMYNQLVTASGTSSSYTWSYSPIKYWPNDFASSAAVDNQSLASAATGSKATTVSFFAYAPYVSVNASTGDLTSGSPTEGITGLTSNAATSDPKVTYKIATTPEKSVDLMWGVAPASTAYTITTSGTQSVTEGMPNKNLTKQATGEKIDFNFKHALARLGLTVQATRDAAAVDASKTELWANNGKDSTKIFVDSVFIAAKFNTTGTLNLNNQKKDTANWVIGAASTTTLKACGDNLNDSLKYATTSPATALASQETGVLVKKATTLMKKDGKNVYFMLIPTDLAGASENITVTIEYTVRTADANLDGGMSTVKNRITKVISGINFEGGKAYTLNLLLGMTSVKVAATVTDWDAQTGTAVNLPINVE